MREEDLKNAIASCCLTVIGAIQVTEPKLEFLTTARAIGARKGVDSEMIEYVLRKPLSELLAEVGIEPFKMEVLNDRSRGIQPEAGGADPARPAG